MVSALDFSSSQQERPRKLPALQKKLEQGCLLLEKAFGMGRADVPLTEVTFLEKECNELETTLAGQGSGLPISAARTVTRAGIPPPSQCSTDPPHGNTKSLKQKL